MATSMAVTTASCGNQGTYANAAWGGNYTEDVDLNVAGLEYLQLGLLLVFIAEYPHARFFFGIPGWVIGAVIVGLCLLTVGVLLTLDNFDVLDAEDYLEYWPVIFVFVGLSHIMRPRQSRQTVAGLNQLATEQAGAHLQDRGILYCPDFLINAGGIIDVHHQRIGSADAEKREHIQRIEQTLARVLQMADESHGHTNDIAEQLARDIISCNVQSLAA